MAESRQEAEGWLAGRIPPEWFVGPAEISADRDEVLVVGALAEPAYPKGATAAAKEAARTGRIHGFREETREQRMRIAREAEHRFGRKVSWGATCGPTRSLFTVYSAPAMTRLRMPERRVLDTLVDAGVARSRSDALAWCVRIFEANQTEWLVNLRDAFAGVEKVRARGPKPRS
jgi:hypothetical protein